MLHARHDHRKVVDILEAATKLQKAGAVERAQA